MGAKEATDNGGHQAPNGGVHVDIYVTPPDGFRLELFSNAVSGTPLQIRLTSILHSGREATVRLGRSKCPVSPMRVANGVRVSDGLVRQIRRITLITYRRLSRSSEMAKQVVGPRASIPNRQIHRLR